jgi:predicted transcriptional regulator
MGTKKGSKPTDEKPVALTVKVDHGTYVRLCTFGANERKTNQDILKQALKEYLDREGA